MSDWFLDDGPCPLPRRTRDLPPRPLGEPPSPVVAGCLECDSVGVLPDDRWECDWCDAIVCEHCWDEHEWWHNKPEEVAA